MGGGAGLTEGAGLLLPLPSARAATGVTIHTSSGTSRTRAITPGGHSHGSSGTRAIWAHLSVDQQQRDTRSECGAWGWIDKQMAADRICAYPPNTHARTHPPMEARAGI